MKQFKNK